MVIVEERLDLARMNEFELRDFLESVSRGGDLYKQRRYKEAIPYLEAGAKMGYKMSQARLAAIYLLGLGGVEIRNEEGIAWLGVAATPTTDPEIRNFWKRMYEQVPDENRMAVDELVLEYIREYGIEATGTRCRSVKTAGSHISRFDCESKGENRLNDMSGNYDMLCALGVTGCVDQVPGAEGGGGPAF